ncbi:hypothetical protein I4U23_010769 [Adineta vaga]|nr:hypothetical protein I4U23_010769 [Adineta vaga]
MFVRLLFCVFIPLITSYPSNKCPSSYCSNDAVCVIKENEPICYCLPEWEGERCDLIRQDNFDEQLEDEFDERSIIRSPECLLAPPGMCVHGVCIFNNNNTYSCQCQPEFIGKRCKEVSPCVGYCANNGRCQLDEKNDPSCNCNGTGFAGPQCKRLETTLPPSTTPDSRCEPMKEMCGHGTCGIVNDRPKCFCNLGYQGDFCDEVQSGGVNSPTPGQPSTTLFPGQTNPPIIPGQTNPPQAGITCAQNPCRNNRPCYNNGNSYFCYCGTQFSGPNFCYNYCFNGKICSTTGDGKDKKPTCDCGGDFEGDRCQVKITTTVGPTTTTATTTVSTTTDVICTFLPDGYCNTGSCVVINNLAVCQCPPTHSGDQCQNAIGGTPAPGQTNPPIIPGQPSTTLFPGQTNPPIIPGQTNPPQAGITCAQNPCRNNRPCYNNGNSYFCYCGTQFSGPNCEVSLG